MKIGKILAITIVFILLIPSISSVASSQGGNGSDPSGGSLIKLLLKIRFRMGYLKTLRMGPYFVLQLRPPTPIQAYPASVNLSYLNQSTFIIGGKNPKNPTEWQSLVGVANGWSWAWWDKEIVYEFVPDNVSNIWNIQFDPEKLILKPNSNNLNWPGAELPFKTNVTISLNPAADLSVIPKDIIIKINIIKTEVFDRFGALKVPKFVTKYKDEYIQKCTETGQLPYFATALNRFMYRIITSKVFFITNLKEPIYDRYVENTVEVLVKVNNYHLAAITPPQPMEIQPYEVKSIPISIKNMGSHIDSYNFRVNCSDENMIVTPPPAVTLQPGEESQVLVGVAAPKTFVSVGSTASIHVDAYSVNDPETVFSNTITLSTSGVYMEGAYTYYTAFIVVTLLIFVALFLYILRKNREKICKKPDKPWKIPEEKKYLEKLDRKEYNKVMKMMEDEYQSALLWYKYYLEAMIRKRNAEKRQEKIKEKKSKTKKVAKEEKIVEKKSEKIPEFKEITPAEPEKKEEPAPGEEPDQEKLRRDQAILKIKREEEKQKRKLA